MTDPARGPFLFDTSAEGWLARGGNGALEKRNVENWFRWYLRLHLVSVSAVTVIERVRGYCLLWHRAIPEAREHIETARLVYLSQLKLSNIMPVDSAVAVVAGEIMALLPEPPTPPQRSHRFAESRQDRLARWRFDGIIAATALVAGIPLLHNNPADFDAIRCAIARTPERFPSLGPLELVRCSMLD